MSLASGAVAPLVADRPRRMKLGWSISSTRRRADISAYDEAVYSTMTSGTMVVTSGGSGFEVRTER